MAGSPSVRLFHAQPGVVSSPGFPGLASARSSGRSLTAYAALKIDLAHRFRYDRDGYSLAKTAFINGVLDRSGFRYQSDIMKDEET